MQLGRRAKKQTKEDIEKNVPAVSYNSPYCARTLRAVYGHRGAEDDSDDVIGVRQGKYYGSINVVILFIWRVRADILPYRGIADGPIFCRACLRSHEFVEWYAGRPTRMCPESYTFQSGFVRRGDL